MFRPLRVLDSGMVELDLVEPIPLTEGFSGDPLRLSAADRAAGEVAVAMGIKTNVAPAKVYGRGADGNMELRRFVFTVPGTQELRSPTGKREPFGGRGMRKRRGK